METVDLAESTPATQKAVGLPRAVAGREENAIRASACITIDDLDRFNHFLAAGVDLDYAHNGMVLFQSALLRGFSEDLPFVKRLIEVGALEHYKENAIRFCIDADSVRAFGWVWEKIPRPDVRFRGRCLVCYAEHRGAQNIQMHFSRSFDALKNVTPGKCCEKGSPLRSACLAGDTRLARALLQRGDDPNALVSRSPPRTLLDHFQSVPQTAPVVFILHALVAYNAQTAKELQLPGADEPEGSGCVVM